MRLPALAAVALLALLASAPAGVAAQGAAQDGGPPPTQVVFAIDDSGSMFGVDGSDPEMQRYDGVINLVEVLGTLLDGEDPREVQIGALSFGTEAQPLAPLASVRDAALAETLRIERDRAAEREATDFRGALCLAWEMVTGESAPIASGCPAATGRGEPRTEAARRLVVLVTDGAPAPVAEALDFAAAPQACPDTLDESAFADSDAEAAADAYLCALGAMWVRLNAHAPVSLIVIGLDQQGQWFDPASTYWRRAAGCDPSPTAAPCDRVVRSVDADSLANLILGAYPTIDLCERLGEGERFNCDVPGGLVGVQFLVTGVPEGGVTIVNDGRDTLRSDAGQREFRESAGDSHVWRLDRPYSGAYEVALEAAALSPSAGVIVDYTEAKFDVGEQTWDAETGELTISLSVVAGGRVRARSAEAQPYAAELRSGGRTAWLFDLRLEHVEGGREFTLTLPVDPEPSEFALYLDLGGGRDRLPVAFFRVPAAEVVTPTPVATATPTSTPAPTPAPTATPTPTPPPVVEEPEEEGGFPLLLVIILAILALVLAPILISAYSVRQPQPYNRRGDRAAPTRLTVPDARDYPRDLVRFGLFAWRDGRPAGGGGPSRTVMLRGLVAGPLVVRRTGRLSEDWRGVPIAGERASREADDLAEDIGIDKRRDPNEADF